ncbi:DNA polymerase III subunit alpha [Blattabacterium cuenoti]|uniref:DNA polymerase III subunit alpha n=1 Tax=Blattabacterium cuenoti TaxID=1653831 RepID=UPI00163C1479|nr:DNA polymerase III subunit alpha [Blattabacterium cuenoti]
MYCILDTETTGLPIRSGDISSENWPRIVQLSWQIHDISGKIIEFQDFIIKPENYDIPFNAFKIHGITNEIAKKYGFDLHIVLNKFIKSFNQSKCVIGHNLNFDLRVIEFELFRKKKDFSLKKKKCLDTKLISMNYCQLPGNKKRFKWPTLSELYHKLFNENILYQHNAANDVKATARCFLELLRIGIISHKDIGVESEFLSPFKEKYTNKIPVSVVCFHKEKSIQEKEKEKKKIDNKKLNKKLFKGKKYSHIHIHTHFSILNSTISIKSLINKAIQLNMDAVGITDYGNMMGSFYFLNAIYSANKKLYPKKKIKGIVGCEMFLSEYYPQNKFTKEKPDKRYRQVFLSKNKKGYQNLSKLCSYGFIKGFYSGIPRIGRKLIEEYKENLIALTGDIHAEIPYTILNYGEKKAEKIFLWWKELFQDDFYIELLRHGLEEEEYINNILLKFSKKFHVKYIVQNNVFYLNKNEANAHDILLCIKSGNKKSTPIGIGKGKRFGFPNFEYYFKNSEEMMNIFSDLPEAFDFLDELIEKIESYHISHQLLLPKFQIPPLFENSINIKYDQNKIEYLYLKELTYNGAKKRYQNIDETIQDRIHFELQIIKKTGYPGYFLIVQDLIHQAKNMNILVGPGRGSVAGSIVAYCIGITEIDPLKYNLLFERFLNPDRISLPDIDIDFDDKGRDKIIDWVANKYGKNQVAQIITYSTMGAKLAIRDVSRVLEFPLKETDRITKMIPNYFSLKNLFFENFSYEKMNKDERKNINNLKKCVMDRNTLLSKVLIQASFLEGTIRSTGIHACGIIICPNDIREYVPVSVSKDTNLLITQFDNHIVEYSGLLKIDLLGLKTLTIIKHTINLIKQRVKNITNLSFSLNDKKTYQLFQKGETIAVFQYESPGMQKYLRQLKPDKFDDLIAMNALYRPGPMQYIPSFISRKHGKEPITYDIPDMEEFLKETYGITIYQEQVMLISQKLSNFSKGEADLLRKAMGKKQREILDKMKNKFLYQSKKNGYPIQKLEKIWKDWEFFSCYAFNKSHATCYAYIAFQTAYLKSHFPHEYMANVLSNNMDNIKQLTFFIEECRRMNITVIGPDINESDSYFRICNHQNYIRFGLTGIKGVGFNAVREIIKKRNNKPFISIFDLVSRVDLRVVNKKTLESLILSGSLDCFQIRREQYFHIEKGSPLSTIEQIIQFSSKFQKKKNQNGSDKPNILECKKWTNLHKLFQEKEVLGVYVSSHPLDDFFDDINFFNNFYTIEQLNKKKETLIGHKIYICGIISKVEKKMSIKSGIKYGIFSLEDYNSYIQFRIYGNNFLKYESFLIEKNILYLYISIEKFKNIELNILHIGMLKNILKNEAKKLLVKIDIHNLNEEFVNHIDKLFQEQIGNKKLDIMIYDKKNQISLKFESEKYGINIDSILLNKLKKIKEVDFCLN